MSSPVSELASSTLFLELLTRRGLQDRDAIAQFLAADLTHLENPFQMKDMAQAVASIQKVLKASGKILIHGDYDVDGITAAAVLARTLSLMGAHYSVFLPERMRDGYGVSLKAIQEAHSQGASLLITADCGITAHDQIRFARENGMEVIIIDHHRIPREGIPEANAVLNPEQHDCAYPFKDLTAAGLAFKLSQALIGDDAFNFLDLVALSTVCDVAPLWGENRILVRHGLKRLSETPNLGLRALADRANLRAKQLNAGHLGFILGPRINACGRMSTPDIAYRLLVTNHAREARSLSEVLEAENQWRQKEDKRTTQEALWDAERSFNFNRDRVLVVGRAGWHQGVVGIVASRLVEKYHRPALVVAFNGEDGKGSGRSIKKFNLFEALQASREALGEFGGHSQAVGFSLRPENLVLFRKLLNQYAWEHTPPEIFVREVQADLEIGLHDLKPRFIEELESLEPYGMGNPRPIFLTRNLRLKKKASQLSHQMLRLWVSNGEMTYEALWKERFSGDHAWLDQDAPFDIYYSVKKNMWNGMETLVLEIKNVQPAAQEAAV